MKTILLAACMTLVAAEAQAISRYDPTHMSCGKVQATIARQGAVILRYQSTRVPGLPLYDRYVQSQQFCTMGEVKDAATLPLARFTVTGPAVSVGAGPGEPTRSETITRLGGIVHELPYWSCTTSAQVYEPPSRSVPEGTCQDTSPLASGVNASDWASCPEMPSRPDATRIAYVSACPAWPVAIGVDSVGVVEATIEESAGDGAALPDGMEGAAAVVHP